MRRQLPRIATFFLLAVATLGAADKRINLLPKLQPGQTITYLIRFQSDKNVKTESKVVAPMAPNDVRLKVLRPYFCDLLDDEVRTRFEEALDVFRSIGMRVSEAHPSTQGRRIPAHHLPRQFLGGAIVVIAPGAIETLS